MSPHRSIDLELLEPRRLLSTNVLSYHRNAAGTGVDPGETILSPSNVNTTTFGKIASVALGAQVFAQPLVVTGVDITVGQHQGVHDVVYVATEGDTVSALDANTGTVLWQDSFLSTGITTVPSPGDTQSTLITPQLGITSTPVVDLATHAIYVLAETKRVRDGNSHYMQRLHALDLGSGTEKFGGSIALANTICNDPGNATPTYTFVSGPQVVGNGVGSVNGKVFYNALAENQRTSLTLINGTIYIASASNGDFGPYHGWIVGFNASTLALTAAFNTTPNGSQGGIWMAGGKLTSDANGDIFATTGNGTFETSLDANGFPNRKDYGDAVLKLVADPSSSPTHQNGNGWGLKVADYFVPFNQDTLNTQDLDLGSDEPLLLPASAGSAQHRNLIFLGGKEGRIYLLDADNLGKFNASADQVVQEQTGIGGVYSNPAFFNGDVFLAPSHHAEEELSIANARFSTTPIQASSDTYGFLGASPSISADVSSNAIAWLMDRDTKELRAYDATTGAELWTSDQAAANRDKISSSTDFATPIIANGHVYIGIGTGLVMFGLLPASPPAISTMPYIAPGLPDSFAGSEPGNSLLGSFGAEPLAD